MAHAVSGRAVGAAARNGDGKSDLITTNQCSGTVSVLLGKGNGTFLPAMNFATGSFPLSVAVAVAAVNDDGLPDLIMAKNVSSSVSVLLNQHR